MKKLAIQGSIKYGKNIIAYFKNMGAIDRNNLTGYSENSCYFIDNNNEIDLVSIDDIHLTDDKFEIKTWPEILNMETAPTPTYPKVMMVSNSPITPYNPGYMRVVFMEKNELYYTWANARSFEEAEEEYKVVNWYYAKDIKDIKKLELTMDEIAEKFGVDVAQLEIKK